MKSTGGPGVNVNVIQNPLATEERTLSEERKARLGLDSERGPDYLGDATTATLAGSSIYAASGAHAARSFNFKFSRVLQKTNRFGKRNSEFTRRIFIRRRTATGDIGIAG